MAKTYSVKLASKDIYWTGDETAVWSDEVSKAQVFSTKKEATAVAEGVVGMIAEVVSSPSSSEEG